MQNPERQTKLKYDKEITIATATNRFAIKWINKSLLISDFVPRITTTTRTQETVEEYQTMSKADRDDVKDVGAFVGGTLKGGRRRKSDVANRHLITLDIDYATRTTKDKIKEVLSDVCFTIYSTHTHTPEKPRYRLIIYPSRVMLPDEYQAVSRKIAERINIEAFDDTSYDTNRLFYWPSTPNDGEFIAYHHDASLLPIDDILAEYGPDSAWKDVSQWPRSSRETAAVDRMLKKQVDPMTKHNVIGAFCRVISIHAAIERWLSDIYKKEGADRYTYIPGSSVKGLVIYDNKFAYSNHDTDPACGQTCNAFDLVRIHKFGHLDSKIEPGVSTTKLPSYKEMIEWAREVEGVKADLVNHKLEINADEFDSFNTEDKKWITKLQINENGTIKATFFNATLILTNDNKIKNCVRFNQFSERMEDVETEHDWSTSDSLKIREYIGERYNVDFPANKIEDAVQATAYKNKYHPVRQYLEALTWDNHPRIETLFIDYFNCDDNPYTRAVSLCWFTAAVCRVYEPGYKFDTSIVLSGPQGIGKTSFLREIGKIKWYGELSSFDPKIAMEEINGKWVVEISELSATNKQELEAQKSFLSACSTRVRMAYERYVKEFRRQCVFMGTTNQLEYLKDSSGNRRWWPLDVKTNKLVDLDKLHNEVDQIWAEAYVLWAINDHPTVLNEEEELIAREVQNDKRELDEWVGIIESWLMEDTYEDRYEQKEGSFEEGDRVWRERVCIPEIWEDCLKIKYPSRPLDRRRIAAILDNVDGWERVTSMRFGMRFGTQKGWKNNIPF